MTADVQREMDFFDTFHEYAATLRAMGRVASGEAQGRRGASRFRGVSRSQLRDGYWRARIGADREEVYNGPSEEAAARAYDRAALRRWGRFAPLNFPRSDYPEVTDTEMAAASVAFAFEVGERA